MIKEVAPVVPQELAYRLTDAVRATHQEFAHTRLDELMQTTDSITPSGEVVINEGADQDAPLHVLALSHQQAWKPSMALRAHLYHQINNPDGVTVVLPNNGLASRAYQFEQSEREMLASGSMRPFFERQTRSVEAIATRLKHTGIVHLAGFSLGGLTSLGIASVGSDRLDVREVHSVEAPNVNQPVGALRKRFLSSATWNEQRAAIADAAVPELSRVLRTDRLARDYASFGIASVMNKDNKALEAAMAQPSYDILLDKALAQYERVRIFAGRITGSHLFEPAMVGHVQDERFHEWAIGHGAGNHRHATVDNIVAHALMMQSSVAQ